MARPVKHTTPEAKLEGKRKSARETARKRRARVSSDMETWERPLPADDPMAASDPRGILVLDGEGPGGIPLPALVASPMVDTEQPAEAAPKRKRRASKRKQNFDAITAPIEHVEDWEFSEATCCKEDWE